MNGTEQNAGNRGMTPERILEMFLEVVQQHPSKSYDFPISNLLDQYKQCRAIPNFTEVAMIINAAGQVYGRKVDHLECLLMSMYDKQNANAKIQNTDNPEQTDKEEKKRPPNKRLKYADQTSTLIDIDASKTIKKTTNAVEKMNLNSPEITDCDRFKDFCHAGKSKTPIVYKRVNLLISDSSDSNFEGARAISKDDSDCQKKFNAFVGCVSFKEKELTSQREFLTRIQFDDWFGCSQPSNANIPVKQPSSPIRNDNEGDVERLTLANDNGTINNENLQECSILKDSIVNDATDAICDGDSAIMDDSSLLNSTAEQSIMNGDSFLLNSTIQDSILDPNESSVNETQTAGESTANQSELLNSTLDISNINQTNGESTCGDIASVSALTNLTAGSELISMNADATNSVGPNDSCFTLNDATNSDLTEINGTLDETINLSAIDPLNSIDRTSANETIQNTSTEKADCVDDTRNIFQINQEYLKLNEIFRLPLTVLQTEAKIKDNIFGIPFGRLRRQVKFALTKDFDSLKTQKRKKDSDECSITGRKIVKLNDGTATPCNELCGTPVPDILSSSNLITDPTLVPTSSTDAAENSPELPSQIANGLETESQETIESGIADCVTSVPSEILSQQESHIPSTESDFFDCDGSPPAKIPRLESQSDALSAFDSGIGTFTEESLMEGTISSRRKTVDLTPSSDHIDVRNGVSEESDELSASRIQEMTEMAEKVSSWHQRLKPILLHSEKRNDFDVKETCRKIVSSFKNQDISFKDVMQNRDKADTARYFFSMLQLANNQNIKITVNHHDTSKLCPEDEIKLKLLDPNIRQIEFDEKQNV